MASIGDDISRLSVSKPPSSSFVTGREPLRLFGPRHGISSMSYPAGRKNTRSKTHEHDIVFEGYNFTVDGGPVRDAKDPKNQGFLESIKNYELPEEFAEDGLHMINVVIGCAALREGRDDVVSKEYLDELYSLMSMEISSP